jgi:hypothetical protein
MLGQLNLVITDNYIHYLLKPGLIFYAILWVSNVSHVFGFLTKFFCEFVFFSKRVVRLRHFIFYSFTSPHSYINVTFYQHNYSEIKEKHIICAYTRI